VGDSCEVLVVSGMKKFVFLFFVRVCVVTWCSVGSRVLRPHAGGLTCACAGVEWAYSLP
jgi:hypothetical protein